jgi:uncharacterized FlgJ-related protein
MQVILHGYERTLIYIAIMISMIDCTEFTILKEKKYLIDFIPDINDQIRWTNFSKANKFVLTPVEDKILLNSLKEKMTNLLKKTNFI